MKSNYEGDGYKMFYVFLAGGLIFLLVTALTIGCSARKTYTLDQMPSYDKTIANENYHHMIELEGWWQYAQQGLTLLGTLPVKPTQAQIDKINEAMDVFLYWRAVAEIQVFNGDYNKSRESAKKAEAAIETIRTTIIAVANEEKAI